jgi:membrane-associated protease RseP (regulator of RpoE activity)
MSKRILVSFLLAALGATATFAQGDADQKERAKAKEKAESEPLAPSVVEFPMTWGARSYLGVYLEEVTADRVKELNLPEERGAIVMKVIAGSPAEKAGLKENDVIVSFNGRRVDSVRELQRLLGETPEGRNVAIEVVRGGRTQTIAATLTKRSQEPPFYNFQGKLGEDFFKNNEEAMRRAEEALKRSQENLKGKSWGDFGNFNFVGPGQFMFFQGGRLGIGAESLTAQLGDYFGVKDGRGVLVTDVRENTPAANAGLKAGDVIIEVDGQKIDNLPALVTEIDKKPEGAVTLKVIRNRGEQTITVMLEKNERRSTIRPRARIMRMTSTV